MVTNGVCHYDWSGMESIQYALLEAPWHLCYKQNDINKVIESWMNLLLETTGSYILHYPFMISTFTLKRDLLHQQTKTSLNDTNLKQQYIIVTNRVVTEIGKTNLNIKINET